MKECDTLIMIGTSFPYMEFLPKPGQAKCVQIELDPTRIGLRHPVDVALAGRCQDDSACAVAAAEDEEDPSS